MLVCTLYATCLKSSIHDLEEDIDSSALQKNIVLMPQGHESQDQFIPPWLHCVSIRRFDILIVNHDSAEVGVNGSNSQLHFCRQLSA